MKKLTFTIVTLLLCVLFFHGSIAAQPGAGATSYTESYSFPINFGVDVPCANDGNGEFVQLSGYVHYVFHVTVDNAGGLHITEIANPQGVIGEGRVTGTRYQGTGVSQSQINIKAGETYTLVDNFKLIAPGPGNNFLLHEVLHITINADGTLSTIVDKTDFNCM